MKTKFFDRETALLVLALALFLLFSAKIKAEIKDTANHITITGYVDVYYAYYTDSVGTGKFQKFPSIAPRSNAFGLNTFQVNMEYNGDKVRAMGVLHYGDIPLSTWSPLFNNIMEAHAGIKLRKN